MQFSPTTHYFILFRPNILLSTLFSNTLSLCSFLNVRDQVSHPYRTIDKITVSNILIFKCLDSQRIQQSLSACETFRNRQFHMVRGRQPDAHPPPPPSWRTTPFWLSPTAYSIYLQLPSISGGHLLHLQPEDAPCRGDKEAMLKKKVK
jgi:hypothetical protein